MIDFPQEMIQRELNVVNKERTRLSTKHDLSLEREAEKWSTGQEVKHGTWLVYHIFGKGQMSIRVFKPLL